MNIARAENNYAASQIFRRLCPVVILMLLSIVLCSAQTPRGADISWMTYEAENMTTTGVKLGPKYDSYLVETESSEQKCVRLATVGQYVEFTAKAAANAIVVRYSLPDSPSGGGIDSTLSLYVNGKLVKKLPITSKYSWLYGKYPFANNPKAGQAEKFLR
ncbi:MAG: hypothetical protein WDM76_03030 [Limisphaerales bacterium]